MTIGQDVSTKTVSIEELTKKRKERQKESKSVRDRQDRTTDRTTNSSE